MPKLKLLNEAKDSTMRWYNSLDRLAQSMPPSTYLTKIGTGKAQQNDPKTVVDISGVSATQARVGEAILRFQMVPDFKSVDLRFTRSTDMPELGYTPASSSAGKSKKTACGVEFEVGAVMKGDDSPAGGTKNGHGQS